MSHFFAMISRMKYIDRWGLMNNTRRENISEHSLEVAILAHALVTIPLEYSVLVYPASQRSRAPVRFLFRNPRL